MMMSLPLGPIMPLRDRLRQRQSGSLGTDSPPGQYLYSTIDDDNVGYMASNIYEGHQNFTAILHILFSPQLDIIAAIGITSGLRFRAIYCEQKSVFFAGGLRTPGVLMFTAN